MIFYFDIPKVCIDFFDEMTNLGKKWKQLMKII